jgi:AAHS family 4-hydroxybenzoate transporter-like MFS transporter
MAVASQLSEAVDVGQVIDRGRWTGYQKWLVFLTALTIIFDGIDNQLLGITIPTIVREWSVPRAAFAPVISLGYLGMLVGGAVAGVAGDRFGRRTALLASMAVFGVMTFGAAVVTSVSALAVLRLLAGLGLGGAIPNAGTLAAEYVPRDRRPLAVTMTIVCVPVGATIAGLLGIRVLPALGWRALFLIGGAMPIVAAIVLARLLPESPRYLVRHSPRWPELRRLLRRIGHDIGDTQPFIDSTERPAMRAPVRALLRPEFRRDTLALWGSFFCCLLAVYLAFSWLTSLLTGAGFSSSVASTGITAFNLGGVVGAIAGGFVIGLVGSRIAMLGMTAGAIAGAFVLSTMTISSSAPILPILVMLTLTGGLINAVQTTMYALPTHVYPSPIRATGVGTALAIGRIGAILSGYAGAAAIDYRGSLSYFALMGIAMCLCFNALALVKHHIEPSGRTPRV